MVDIVISFKNTVCGIDALYHKHSLNEDAKQFVGSLLSESYFLGRSITHKLDEEKNKFTITIDGLRSTTKKSSFYFMIMMENKLTYLDISTFYTVTSIYFPSVRQSSDTIMTFEYSSDNDIPLARPLSKNQKIISECKFDEMDIPDEFICSITSSLMDIPAFDSNDDTVKYDYRNYITATILSKVDPYNRKNIFFNTYEIDLNFHDTINNFIAKIKFMHDNKISYKDNMHILNNHEMSFYEYIESIDGEPLMPPEESRKDLFYNKKGLEHIKHGHYKAALFYFKKAQLSIT